MVINMLPTPGFAIHVNHMDEPIVKKHAPPKYKMAYMIRQHKESALFLP
jgi:hypothetical protein